MRDGVDEDDDEEEDGDNNAGGFNAAELNVQSKFGQEAMQQL